MCYCHSPTIVPIRTVSTIASTQLYTKWHENSRTLNHGYFKYHLLTNMIWSSENFLLYNVVPVYTLLHVPSTMSWHWQWLLCENLRLTGYCLVWWLEGFETDVSCCAVREWFLKPECPLNALLHPGYWRKRIDNHADL